MTDAVLFVAVVLCIVTIFVVERTGRKKELKNAESRGYEHGYKDACIFYYDSTKNNWLAPKSKKERKLP